MNETKTRILDAAESLLAERGFDAASLRAITARAGANLGAVNYHFRSKEALIQAVFARRLQPINQQRLAALDACQRRAGRRPVPLASLLRAFIGPVLKCGREGRGFFKLMGRMYSDPSLGAQRIFTAELGETVDRFLRAFRRTLPHLEAAELFWRLFFTIGSMAQVLAAGPLLRFISGEICDPDDIGEAENLLVRFAAAGLRAPAAGKKQGVMRI
jgi:AcrR family transcriptional regulator